MNLISYKEAASRLDISVGTLKQALKPSRGDILTKVRRANSMLLIEEQVMLFVGISPHTGHKKRLSLRSLTPEERTIWKELANEANGSQTAPIIDEEMLTQIVRQEMLRQAREEAEKKAEEAREEEERFRKEHPKLKREKIPA